MTVRRVTFPRLRCWPGVRQPGRWPGGACTKISGVMGKRKAAVSPEATAKHEADVALAAQFDDLMARAQETEQALRDAQANGASEQELHDAGKRLDSALTDVMRAAFAAQRAEIGARGYDDRIVRRKAMATPKVRSWTMEAERLLTLRESHRLTEVIHLRRPSTPDHSDAPGGAVEPPPSGSGQSLPTPPGSTGYAGDQSVLPRAASVT